MRHRTLPMGASAVAVAVAVALAGGAAAQTVQWSIYTPDVDVISLTSDRGADVLARSEVEDSVLFGNGTLRRLEVVSEPNSMQPNASLAWLDCGHLLGGCEGDAMAVEWASTLEKTVNASSAVLTRSLSESASVAVAIEHDLPYRTYLMNTTEGELIECARGFYDRIPCISNATGRVVAEFGPVVLDPAPTATCTVFEPQTTEVVLEVMLSRMSAMVSHSRLSEEIRVHNRDRLDLGAVIFALGLALMLLGILALSLAIGVLQSWLTPWFRLSRKHSMWLWTGLMTLFSLVLTLSLGFLGLILVEVLLVLHFLILLIFLCCARYSRKSRDLWTKKGPRTGGTNKVSDGEAPVSHDAPVSAAGTSAQHDEHAQPQHPSTTPAKTATADEYSRYPHPLAPRQSRVVTMCSIVVVFVALCLMSILVGWQPTPYWAYDRRGVIEVEYSLRFIAQTSLLLYSHPGVATFMKQTILGQISTDVCEDTFNKILKNDKQKRKAIQEAYIETYNIDMSIFARPNYWEYESVNDWFTRELAEGARPIVEPENGAVLVSPADSRMVFFEDVQDDFRTWIKHESFGVRRLLGRDERADEFLGGTIAIARLAPEDYHRFHAPAKGHVLSWTKVGGTQLSVGAEASRSGNQVFYNERRYTFIETEDFGTIAYVAVGAACVNSVIPVAEDEDVEKGQEMGYFEFGGSTIVMVFEPNRVIPDYDILYNALNDVETYVNMGTQVGLAGVRE